MADESSTAPPGGPRARPFFPATHWTEIATIRGAGNEEAEQALENLCRTYLPALENYLRWVRNLPGDPHELANEFLAQFIHQDSLSRVDRSKGRFRNYLLGAIRNFLRTRWKSQAGVPVHVELDDSLMHEDPDREALAQFDRKFAEILVGNAIDAMRARFVGSRIEGQIPALLPYLGADPPEETLRQLAGRLGVSDDLIYQNFKRIRSELFVQLRRETRRHLGPDDDVDEEMQAMLRVYARG
jgi:DNA-directed RNA polymerase specialized sigma24 family protein